MLNFEIPLVFGIKVLVLDYYFKMLLHSSETIVNQKFFLKINFESAIKFNFASFVSMTNVAYFFKMLQ